MAQIEFIPQNELHKLFALTTTELIELIQAGDWGRAAINTIRRALDLVLPSLEKVNLANADLRGLNLGHVSLAETNLRGANLTSIRIDGRGYHGGGMAICHRACLDNAIMVDADLSFVELDGASFRDVDLRNASFENATLVEANFTRANLTGTVLKADLSRAKLNEAVLRGVRIDGCLEGTSLAGFDLSETEIEGSLLPSLDCSFQGASPGDLF